MTKIPRSKYDFFILGRRIQVRRKDLGMTQEQLAEKLQCSLSHLSRIEGGARPSLEYLLRLSPHLHCGLDELLGLDQSNNPYWKQAFHLFLDHSQEDQKLALAELRHFFLLLDFIHGKNCRPE